MARAKRYARPPAIDPKWPRWEISEGTSRFTCQAPDARTAEAKGRCAGFWSPNARMIEPRPDTERESKVVALSAAAPKRAEPGKIIRQQHDESALPLFIAANEPRLI